MVPPPAAVSGYTYAAPCSPPSLVIEGSRGCTALETHAPASDDDGGFYDHAISPFEGVPADGSPCHVEGSKCEAHFDFRRLGPRLSAQTL